MTSAEGGILRSLLVGLLLSAALVGAVAALGGGEEAGQHPRWSPSQNSYVDDDLPHGRIPW
ncbi:hypothetical protein C8E97_3298 [Saccharothrix australiensis]|uniref:Uncharacterized protein n=1 Tax=Saccharothrix australiensis TaxID=2072 RepID=A0A495VYZ7_9PSEU|nr:hypothetical protein C8E97_3298 [Saccharothrix australiensis]